MDVWALLIIPLAASFIITLFTRRHKELSSYLSVAAILACRVIVLPYVFKAIGDPHMHPIEQAFPWISIRGLTVEMGTIIDSLSVIMLFIVTFVGALIHIYARGYMEGDPWTLGLAALLIFCGAVGKSAQFPLHVWLPDAMEGPTPVSALIHAATMVTAGVYMVTRCTPLFLASTDAQHAVAIIGTITVALGGVIALTQTDLKRVLAYSTLSQLGYMFAALGAGAKSIAFFHLFTHAFFKALLFLAAGSIIHAP